MALLDRFVECCEREREALLRELTRAQASGNARDIARLERSIAELDAIIASPVRE